MDIVDTFNHLIPTEHLDDALFLGSNLENEVCEDFSTSQNVLEDSLKNMLSDKDPMLGSASNQFCLPVLDSNDPNFQMPCSTVVGLDDIMDEGVVKESGNDTIDEEELILPNRNLRDKVEENSVTSPRKSPRLMAQEQVRSLRQSTIAKRSNAAPLSSTKKPSGKTVSVSKSGTKPPERCQSKEEVCTSLKPEYHKENRRSSRHTGQIETVPEVSVSSSHSSVSSCLETKDEAGFNSEHKCNNQGEASVPSHKLNCPLLSETCLSTEENKSEALMECKIKAVNSPLFKFSDKEEHEQTDSISGKMDETIVEEMKTKERIEQESKETVKLSHENDQIIEEPGTAAGISGDAACTNPNKTEKNPVCLSSSVDEVTECNLELKNAMDVADKAENAHLRKMEPLDYCEVTESNDKQLQNTELNKSNLEVTDTSNFHPESNILENTVCDAPDQNLKQLIIESVNVESHETTNFQDARNSQPNSVPCLESKNLKSKHTKPIIHSKQNMTTDTPKKIVTAKHETVHNKTKVNVKSIKRNADEPEFQQNFHRPVKDSGEGKSSSDCRDSEIKKWQLAPLPKMRQPVLPRRASEEKSEKILKESTTVICTGEKTSKPGTHEKQEMKKKKVEKGVPNVHPPAAAASKPSTDQIRQSVRHSLKDILMKRLTDSNLKVPEEKAAKVATKIEKELFSFFRDTDAKYKNKYRSLMFNLKDPKNNTIEMIEKEQREVERRPITKITHKGEIEIESDAPMKEQEATMEIQEPTANKSLEKPEGSEKQKEEIDSMSKDTTGQHRQHLFDLNCKICIGRMAPPADDLSPKKVKVVVGVARKHSDNEAESIADALSSTSSILASEFFEEEKQESPKSTFSPAPRPEMPGTVEVESTFLARLNFIWKGFINMPSVAKFVTKAYPVSGSPEYLTEEICVVRFTPVTEEDQISYTLLFAYFSSRKRYGVAANNMKQVKDMYLIPLGAADKIPHPLVPFDGPGLELHRPNLLLGLIIRQKLKRQHSASASTTHTAEAAESAPIALPPDKKGKIEVSTEETAEEENDFFNSFTTVLHKQRNKPQQALQEDLPAAVEPLMEVTKQEPPKPLRFLPGVLIGWENQPSTLELANKPLPVDDILQSLLGTTSQVYEQSQSVVEQNTPKEIPFINEQTSSKAEKIDTMEVTDDEAKEVKVKVDTLSESIGSSVVVVEETETSVVGSSSISPGPLTSLSLRGKPPDVSTEAFLTNLSIQSKQEETVESKERTLKRQLLQDQENNLQDNQTSNTSSPCRSNVGKGNIDGNVSCSENLVTNTTRSPPFINLKRDPRQAAGRSQQVTPFESKDGDSCRNGEKQALPGVSQNKEHLPEQVSVEEKSSVEKNSCGQQSDHSKVAQNSPSLENTHTSQTDQAKPKPLQEEVLMQNIETVHPFRRGSAATTSHFEVGNTCQSEFPSKSINFTSRSTSPRTSTNFSPIRPQQPNLQHLKSNPPGFPFPGPPNFPPQSMFGFPPHLPPPLLPPPGFGFAQNPMVPWPPVVHLPGQPQRMMGPLSQASRYIGPQNFYQVKDIRRPERRHSDPWGRQDQQQLDRPFNRGKGDRQRFYSDSHHLKRERHEKEWEQESERHRRRDRSQDKDRDRKSREEGHKDKERARLSHGDRGADGKASRDGRNIDKKTDKPKSEDHEKDKEREKSKHREGEKDRDRYHKDRDHTDRAKSKR
ncbi:PHD finger protein 3 [Tupaia chinensis]|uniref:PHD finger protein 3 n=1 Tax=Tupaia chinensis TaxID=246437 RepID=L8YDK5_TUPCH|nr:PHD finger protein 3 [Tupaia chinensis]